MTYEREIREKLTQSADDGEAARLSIDLAIYLARGGHFEEATSIYEKYHRSAIFGEEFVLSLRLMLLDSMLLFYRKRDIAGAIDRAHRALRLSLMGGGAEVTSNLSAWLAHFQFNACRYEEMADSMRLAVEHGSFPSTDTAARLSLTFADAMALSGRPRSADTWYKAARNISFVLGDQLYIGAIVHNRSTLGLARLRYEIVCMKREIADCRGAILELTSAASYERYIDSRDSVYPYDLWRARIELLKEEYESALKLLTECLAEHEETAEGALRAQLLADLGYCYLKAGDLEAAVEFTSRALQCNLQGVYADDLAIIHSHCSSVAEQSGDARWRAQSVQLMNEAMTAFGAEQRRIGDVLDSISPRLSERIGIELTVG